MQRRGFTLIELIAVLVVLAVLAGIALPRYFNRVDDAKASSDDYSIASINTALIQIYTRNRANDAPADQWITTIPQVAGALQFDELPAGILVDDTEFVDQRGNRYTLIPETATSAARLSLTVADAGGAGDPDPGAGGGGGGGGSGGSGGGDTGGEEGAGDVPLPALLLCLLPWAQRPRRASSPSARSADCPCGTEAGARSAMLP